MTIDAEHCLTCGDIAVAARVCEIDGDEAVVERDGRSERVGIDLVPDARLGDVLLCHAGIALDRLEGDTG